MGDLMWLIPSGGIFALILLMGILVIWKTLKEKKSGYPLTDERTQKINWRAGYYAMFIGQYFILAYVAISIVGREFFGMPEIEAGYPMLATLLVISLSYCFLSLHFSRKGDL
jgi:hypothetical protein